MGRAGAVVVALLPILAIGYLQLRPESNPELLLPSEHFYIVTLVSAMAALVSLLVARTAVQMEQFQVLLVALGFACLAGFFSVHALATPGILIHTPLNAVGGASGSEYGQYGATPTPGPYGAADPYAAAPAADAAHQHSAAGFSYDGTIIGLSAFLSLFVASFFFAASYPPWALAIKRRTRASGSALLAAV